MKALKKCVTLLLILLFTLIVGCSKVDGKDTQSIKAPKNESLSIGGAWKIEDINILDEEIENTEEILKQSGNLISISNNKVSIFNKEYLNPSFKLKVVDEDYVLSYELNLKINDIIDDISKLDVISIIDSNSIVGEFIHLDEDNGYLFYSGMLIKLFREDKSPKDIENSKDKVEAEFLNEDYNSDVGAMIALKTPRTLNEDGTYSAEEYRTLWVSFKDQKLQPTIEKENIVFPRLNGIWTIESDIYNRDDKHVEYFTAKPLEGKVEENNLVLYSDQNIYKNINFISNDYISIEKYEGNSFNNIFPIYQTVPIDNINSNVGISIDEIFSGDAKEKYKNDFNEALNTLSDSKKDLVSAVDYTNFTLKRNEGKWTLNSNIITDDLEEDGITFKLSLSPSKKLLNYDTLLIPWKDLKGKFPFITDAYTAPTGRLAFIVLNDKLLIYELEDKNIKGNPLEVINLRNDEEIIMVEWASGSYVSTWSRAFKDGIEINMEED
ncbi:hypothetical protein [Clostridium tertium]|uniref:Lipoprotein n=1 Tax=Clostridium tertium TaxID=1559 RepID=A0A6N3CPC2_9CLOT